MMGRWGRGRRAGLAQRPTELEGALDRRSLLRVLWRSLFILATFNPRDMQAAGFASALGPGLERLYPDDERFRAAFERHLHCPFNTHPYVAAAIMGGVLFHEERVARREETPQDVERFKLTLMGPLAALGDGFFWLSLRPAAAALGACVALLAGLWGVLLYALLFNAVHFAMRASYLFAGYRLGDQLLASPLLARLPAMGQRLRYAAMAATVAVVGAKAAALHLDRSMALARPALWFAGVWLAFALAVWLLKMGVSRRLLFYGSALAALALGWAFGSP